jgi:hypothetical protein
MTAATEDRPACCATCGTAGVELFGYRNPDKTMSWLCGQHRKSYADERLPAPVPANNGNEIATVVTPFMTIAELVGRLHRKWAQGETMIGKLRSIRLEVGNMLLELRQRVEAGEVGDIAAVDWWGWYEDNFRRSRRDAERLMEIASADDPQAALEQRRAYDAAQSQAYRDRKKQAQIAPTDVSRSLDPEPAEPPPPLAQAPKPSVRRFPEADTDDEIVAQIAALFRQLSWGGRNKAVNAIKRLYDEWHRNGSVSVRPLAGRDRPQSARAGLRDDRTREAGAAAGSGVIGVLWRTLDAGDLHDCGMRNGRAE